MSALKAFFADLYRVVPFFGRWILSYSAELAAAGRLFVARISGELACEDQKKSLPTLLITGFQNLLLLLLYHPLQFILTGVSLVLHAMANLVNKTLLRSDERGLIEEERQYLYAIFSNNLRYEKIRIQFGGIKEILKISPQAVGNDIFLRKKWGTQLYYDDLSLSIEGMRLLGHEACHVWQSQHVGAQYIGDSLLTQTFDLLGRWLRIPLSHGYNILPALRENTPYENCNVEQQAVIAELIGITCATFDVQVLNRDQFCKACGISLNDEEFEGVSRAHRYLQQTAQKVPLGL